MTLSRIPPGVRVQPAMYHFLLPALILISLMGWHTASHAELSLDQAEKIASEADPLVAASQARALALTESAIADGQLPDPKLKFGVFNLPTDTFDFNQEPTTQVRLGIQQAFPRGDTLKYKQKQTTWKSTAETQRSETISLKVNRNVRLEFLELFYQVRAGQIIQRSRDVFADLVKITQAHYGAGRVSQQDVLRAELELSRLDDRATHIRNREAVNRAALRKWIGSASSMEIEDSFPTLPELTSLSVMGDNLQNHAEIRMESSRIEAWNQGVSIAREQYKPGWSIGVEYRARFGDNPDGSNRTDMTAAMLTVDLPLFTDKRQDKRLSASQQQADAARLVRDDRLRQLQEMLDREYANW
ncbi:MAG TPA: TolC family protein, partial [Gammaproteobacteria bacterium]|nr:TolC family protein [Gammaproteobacteria bacterium]